MSLFVRMSCLLSGILLSANVMAAETEIIQPVAEMTLAQMEGEEEAAADADASMEGEASMGDEASMGGEADAGAVAEAPADPAPAPVATEADNAPADDAAPAADEEPFYKKGWTTEWHGYVRAPAGFSIAKRRDPGVTDGDEHLQSTFLGGNHIIDNGYSSFAFTRLQETEWAEILLTAKREHIAATVALMGWWYQFVGKGNPNGAVSPGLGFLTLDTDFNLGSIKPHIALTMGAFLKVFGGTGIYDTYIFQRSHLMGEQVELTLPVSDGFKLTLTHGFGYGKAGIGGTPSYDNDDGDNTNDPTGITLAHYLAAVMNIGGKIDVGAYYNSSWSNDPTFHENGAAIAGSFEDMRDARMRVIGADVHLRIPKAGHLWLAYSHIGVTNGWALDQGIEVMHSAGGAGIVNNYLGASDTGSGAMNNLAWQYENSIQGIKGVGTGNAFPDLTFEGFGMMASVKAEDVPDDEEDSLMQIKGGGDIAFWPVSWMGLMFRYDAVNLDNDMKFKVFTPRLIFASHFLSGEQLWFQVSKYMYSDEIKDSSGFEDGPDATVFKMQAVVGF